ncbi:MAG: hypothetical protein CBD97_04195, partial [Pelagibacteraceae bacterium TMED237]
AGVQIWNKAVDSTEVKELYSGMSVPYKYKGANQTDLIEANVSGSGTSWTGASGATAPNGWDAGGSGRDYAIDSGTLQMTAGSGNAFVRANLSTIKGKSYRLQFIYKNNSGSVAQYSTDGGNTMVDLASSTSFSSVQSVEFVGTGAEDVLLVSKTNSYVTYWDNVSLTRIGSVAEYDGSGIASDKWFDKSSNDLHGTVSGATVENAPAGDDGLVYEEGTFSPLMTGITNTSWHTLAGFYKRVGNLVSFKLIIRTTTGDATNSSNVEITGLPYTSDSTSNSNGGAYITYSSDFDDDDSSSPQFNIEPGTTKIEVFKSNGARFTGNDMDSVTVLLRLNGQYYT